MLSSAFSGLSRRGQALVGTAVLGGVALTVAVLLGGLGIVGVGGSNGSKGVTRSPGNDANQSATASNAGQVGDGANSGKGGPQDPTSDPTPRVPKNDVVTIYNIFGLSTVDRPVLDGLTERFQSEGYTVTEYKDTTEGAGDHGGATLENFVGMAGRASVIIINTHGTDFSGTEQQCTAGKSISRCATVFDPSAPSATSTTKPTTTTTTTVTPKALVPTLQVEWYPTWSAEQAAYKRYIASGYDANWLFDPYDPVKGNIWATTLIPWRSGDGAPTRADGTPDTSGEGERPWLGITDAGIAHFFKNAKVDLIDNMACHSMAVASSFNARSYFGHASTACAGFEAKDEPTLFDRLIGKSDVAARPTTKAFALGGFVDKYFQLAEGAQPIVLSPAVETVTPARDARIKPAANTPATVKFDAVMDQKNPDEAVTIKGCDATIQNAKWSNDHTLAFDINVPQAPATTIGTLTIHNDRTKAEPGTAPNHYLDGNSDPPARSGLAKNRDDYTWQVSCGSGTRVEIRTSGKFRSNFDTSGDHGVYSYQLDFTWEASRLFDIKFGADGQFTANPVGPGTLTAAGKTTTSSTDGLDNCQWSAAAAPNISILVRGGGEVNKGNGIVRLFQASASMPVAVKSAVPTFYSSNALDDSGACAANRYGPLPYLYQSPAGGVYDPDGQFRRLVAGDLGDVDFDALLKGPFSLAFPVDYTQTAPGIGGVEHVVANGTVTVTLAG